MWPFFFRRSKPCSVHLIKFKEAAALKTWWNLTFCNRLGLSEDVTLRGCVVSTQYTQYAAHTSLGDQSRQRLTSDIFSLISIINVQSRIIEKKKPKWRATLTWKWAAWDKTISATRESSRACAVFSAAVPGRWILAAQGSDCPHVLIYSLSFCKHTEQRPNVQPNRSHDTCATWSGSIFL